MAFQNLTACQRFLASIRPAAAIFFACLGAACLDAVACARADTARDPAGAASRPRAKGGGGELRVVLPFEPADLDPDFEQDEAALLVAPNLFSKLVELDARSRLMPALAESWHASADGRVYTFRLRSGVRWHDGEPLTAEDVRWTFQALAGVPSPARETLSRLAAIATPDARTVVLTLREPWAPFLTSLAGYCTAILPRHRLAGRDLSRAPEKRRPVGSGPFRFLAWIPGQRITLVANRDYFGPGPYLDKVVYLFEPDSRRIPGLMLSGGADYTLMRPPLEALPALADSPRLAVETEPADSRYYIGFNLRRPPLDDPRVREAINRAIDRPLLVARALAGYGAPALGFYTPTIPWAYDGMARVPPFDPAGARRLLAAAGLAPDGRGVRLRLDLVSGTLSPYAEISAALARQLAAVGIDVHRILLPPEDCIRRLMRDHDFDLGLIGGSQGPDPENLSERFGSRGLRQFMGYGSAAFDTAVGEGARWTGLARRAAAYHRAQQVLARDLPIAPLAEGVRIFVYSRRVHGLPQAEALGLVPLGDYSLVHLEGETETGP